MVVYLAKHQHNTVKAGMPSQHNHHAARRSLFSDIFIPAKSSRSIPGKMFVVQTFFSFLSVVNNCIRLRHVVGALDLDCVFHTVP